jgi:ABC-2 type transport system permease protein
MHWEEQKMFSKSLMKKTVKENFTLWAVMTGVLIAFLLISLGVMVSVSNGSFGGGNAPASGGDIMTGGIINQYYSMFAILIPMIYIFLTANKLIAAKVDKGSLSYVMANPIKRNQVSVTQAIYLISSIVAMFTLITVAGLILITATGLNIATGSFILLNVGAMLLLIAISGISYLASCIFNLSGRSLAVGAGIPIAFFLFSTLSSFSSFGVEALKYFKYFTINTLYNISDVLAHNTNMTWEFIVLFGIMAVCYAGGVLYFKKKDLPL